jgi:hypothetical protein
MDRQESSEDLELAGTGGFFGIGCGFAGSDQDDDGE